MKPITDDIVHALVQGIAAREKPGRRNDRSDKKTAKILNFAAAPAKRDVIALHGQKTRRTISGVFCYVARMRSV